MRSLRHIRNICSIGHICRICRIGPIYAICHLPSCCQMRCRWVSERRGGN